jgi:hypothetical protein
LKLCALFAIWSGYWAGSGRPISRSSNEDLVV